MEFPETASRGYLPLLTLLTERITQEDVEAIARADYGIDQQAHAEAIDSIRRTGEIALPMDWIPREVLNLTRWSLPEEEPDRPRAHLRRAFASMAVLYADTEDQLGWGGSNETMAALTQSAHELGAEVVEAAADFAAWIIPRETEEDELPFLGLAFFSLALPSRKRWNDATMLNVADWVMQMENAVAAPWSSTLGLSREGPWLLNNATARLRDHLWRRIGSDLEGLSRRARRSAPVTEVAALFGKCLAD